MRSIKLATIRTRIRTIIRIKSQVLKEFQVPAAQYDDSLLFLSCGLKTSPQLPVHVVDIFSKNTTDSVTSSVKTASKNLLPLMSSTWSAASNGLVWCFGHETSCPTGWSLPCVKCCKHRLKAVRNTVSIHRWLPAVSHLWVCGFSCNRISGINNTVLNSQSDPHCLLLLTSSRDRTLKHTPYCRLLPQWKATSTLADSLTTKYAVKMMLLSSSSSNKVAVATDHSIIINQKRCSCFLVKQYLHYQSEERPEEDNYNLNWFLQDYLPPKMENIWENMLNEKVTFVVKAERTTRQRREYLQ